MRQNFVDFRSQAGKILSFSPQHHLSFLRLAIGRSPAYFLSSDRPDSTDIRSAGA